MLLAEQKQQLVVRWPFLKKWAKVQVKLSHASISDVLLITKWDFVGNIFSATDLLIYRCFYKLKIFFKTESNYATGST